jgi:hypothetical protein
LVPQPDNSSLRSRMTRCFGRSNAISGGWAVTVRRITFHHAELRGEGSNPASPSAIDLGSLLSSSVDQPQNPQQTETFRLNDRTRDYRRDGNLRLETTFFSKDSYFAVLVQF